METVHQKVFEWMLSERKRIAERSRSEGQGRAAEIRGQKERDVLAASSVGYKCRADTNAGKPPRAQDGSAGRRMPSFCIRPRRVLGCRPSASAACPAPSIFQP